MLKSKAKTSETVGVVVGSRSRHTLKIKGKLMLLILLGCLLVVLVAGVTYLLLRSNKNSTVVSPSQKTSRPVNPVRPKNGPPRKITVNQRLLST